MISFFGKILKGLGKLTGGGGGGEGVLPQILDMYIVTLFYYAGHTQQKLVSRWSVGKHITLQ